MSASESRIFNTIYRKLYRAFGPQHWWPGHSKLEIIVGAILTQNTNWKNVEQAIRNLKEHKVLSVERLKIIPQKTLAAYIRPAGYFNVKAKRLKNFIRFLNKNYNGQLLKMQGEETQQLRRRLLEVNGIGPETADSILLYAFDKPVFVIDGYTKRIFYRHKILDDANESYHAVQEMMMSSLKYDVKHFNEYHALIVRLAKEHCRTKARCSGCALNDLKEPFGIRASIKNLLN